ncbi:MAG: dihydrofolate reductase family protein [bacterium]|nr:dihydrofolate reductase family protein [bacterium]
MKTFLIAALSADGFIAKTSAHTSMVWTSKEDKQFFVEMTNKAGVVVMGQNTYETIGKPLPGRHNVVYSRDRQYEGVQVTQAEPAALLKELEGKGYKEVAICGGATIYTMFMEAGLIDKLYLTVEPIVFGQGLTLFNKELDVKLALVQTRKLGEQTLLLEYDVVK